MALEKLDIDELVDTFEFMDDWEERYKYVIDLGRDLPEFPEDERAPENKVRGCASQVWLIARETDDAPKKLVFLGDSDAHIVKGLIAILLLLYSGKTPGEILQTDPRAVLARLGLEQHLSPMRTNGLFSMIGRIRAMAEAARDGAAQQAL